MPIVIGLDAAWGGLGIAICTASRPVYVAHHKPGGKKWRTAALIEILQGLEHHVADLAAHSMPGDPLPRVVYEKAPRVYAGRGNQSATAYGLGTMAGGIEVWACRRSWAYPWNVTPDVWRRWWWAKPPKGRRKLKKAAYLQVINSPWKSLLDGLEIHKVPGDYEGPAVDLAEAILIGMGAARRLASPLTANEAPRGPVAWERERRRGTLSRGTVHPQLIAPCDRPNQETT